MSRFALIAIVLAAACDSPIDLDESSMSDVLKAHRKPSAYWRC